MPNNPSREAFELWATDNGEWPLEVRRSTLNPDVYMLTLTQSDWMTWQAAIESMSQHKPGELCPACAASEFERVSGFGGLT